MRFTKGSLHKGGCDAITSHHGLTVRRIRIIVKPNRIECARTEQSRLSEVFCGKQYSSDCIEPTECSPVRNRLALALEQGRNQDPASGNARRPPYKCRHKAGCSEKVSRPSPPPPRRLPQPRARAVVPRESAGCQNKQHVGKRPLPEREPSSVCRDTGYSRS